ncbi:polyprotein [Marine RNA virus PAL438]|uniref:polyprotein n=1 Tax=Marine RNA virus PAL438 TaxID=1804155 RepID=UPI00077553C1|nr:polyprotein [Marine RNA virus PAL438]AMK49157.1 polyprotein [Marine RNA virus PAL438]
MSMFCSLHIVPLFFIMALIRFLIDAIYYACCIDHLLSLAGAVKAGATRVANISRSQYIDRLTWMRSLMRFSSLISRDERRRTLFIRISNILENLRLDNSDGKLRPQPYCVILTGFPGTGKTSFAMQIAAKCIRDKYNEFHPHDVVTLNETDEYQSEYRTSHKVVIFDDLGAEMEGPKAPNPWRKIIDFVNNIRKTSLNPNVELKGNVYIEPDLVIITTNLRPEGVFSSNFHLKCTSALARRLNDVYQVDKGFKMCTPVLLNSVPPTKNAPSGYACYNTQTEVKRCEPVTRDEASSTISQKFLEHTDEQRDFIDQQNNCFDKESLEQKSTFNSFLDDIIVPYWPKVPIIEDYFLPRLTWFQRGYRCFCIKDPNIIVAQGDMGLKVLGIEQQEYPHKSLLETPLPNSSSLLDYINIHKKYHTPFGEHRLLFPPAIKEKMDKYHECVMATKPDRFQLIAYEWMNPVGRGDFVFADTKLQVVVVIEVGSKKIKPIRRQAFRYAQQLQLEFSFHRLDVDVLSLSFAKHITDSDCGEINPDLRSSLSTWQTQYLTCRKASENCPLTTVQEDFDLSKDSELETINRITPDDTTLESNSIVEFCHACFSGVGQHTTCSVHNYTGGRVKSAC